MRGACSICIFSRILSYVGGSYYASLHGVDEIDPLLSVDGSV